MNEQCGTCIFFSNNECRRFPPTLIAYHTIINDNIVWNSFTGYPERQRSSDGCGEYKENRSYFR